MPRSLRRIRLFARFAVLVILVGTLAPALMQATVRAADAGRWMEVCSVAGMIRVASSPVDAQSDARAENALDLRYCPLFVPLGGHVALPGSVAWLPPRLPGAHVRQSYSRPPAVAARTWLKTSPRGPPDSWIPPMSAA
ncbi:DUF2946 domain-containing protein [Pseudothauera nasutitermitis]|uniref:DUF2946 domain-containing protein n=1 Tax=Pseudothauera nasutitermitis TaxID=2565930 RepID=A0A4V3WCG3_9RHOO|nr:DUF2946 family protein [Pseudothauera nasutitermitis]THF67114.1 DUF2946 domain-containing protein [Pseudothauera nasutitermitis]